ncbi:MAG: hypothetical protein HY870_20030 [Chloroflexi bacterium]|nr:hypothetical protein [Chloroflexota bacterium]
MGAVLTSAALLHDAGVVIDFYHHDAHSAYLIMNAELPGFSHREIALMALLAQHHRRGTPDIAPFKGLLTREDEERAARLSALLRLAEYLDRSRTQIVQELKCRVSTETVTLICHARGDASTEQWATQRNADLFKQAFRRDLSVQMQPIKATKTAARPSDTVTPLDSEPLLARVQEIMRLLNAAP